MSVYTSLDSDLFRDSGLLFVLSSKAGLDFVSPAAPMQTPYAGLNLAYHVGDDASRVRANRLAIVQSHYPHKKLVYLDQIHSSLILEMHSVQGSGDEILLGRGDGLISSSNGIVGLVLVADCNPVLLYSAKKRVFALLHAGRLGVMLKVTTAAISRLCRDYGVSASELRVFIGASIRACCYEIGHELERAVSFYFGDKYLVRSSAPKAKLDLVGMLEDELLEGGVLPSNVEIFPVCSCCNEGYFSYRREGVTGRFGLFASLI